MVFADKLHDIIEVLENDGVILYPGDTTWAMGAAFSSQSAVDKIRDIKKDESFESYTLLVSSLKMLKDHVEIHPRIETLLHYHEQPLTIVYKKTNFVPTSLLDQKGKINVRLVKDPFVNTIIDLLGEPLFTTLAHPPSIDFPKHFGEINQEIISNVDYVCKHRRMDKKFMPPSVMITYDEKGDITFLRK